MEYAERISVIRAELGFTQPQLAAALDVSVRSIQNYEAGTTIPYKHFRRLEELGGKPPGWMEQDGHPDVSGHGWRGMIGATIAAFALFLPAPANALSPGCNGCGILFGGRKPRIGLARRSGRAPAGRGRLRS